MRGSPSESAAETPLEPGWVTFPQHPSCQPRVVLQAGLEVRASWKRGCQSTGTHHFRSPPITFTKRVPACVRSVRPHHVPGGVGTGPQTPGQTGHQGNSCSQLPLSCSALLEIQKRTRRKTQGPEAEEDRVQRTRDREAMRPQFSPVLSPVLESKRGHSRPAPRACSRAFHLPAIATGSRRA